MRVTSWTVDKMVVRHSGLNNNSKVRTKGYLQDYFEPGHNKGYIRKL